MGLLLFLVVAFFAAMFFIMGFPLLRAGTTQAAATLPSNTANITAFSGLIPTVNWYPLAAFIILFGAIVFGIWQFIREWKTKSNG